MREKKVEKHPAVIINRIVIIGEPEKERIRTGCSRYEEELVNATTGTDVSLNKEKALSELKRMHPGLRELRMKTFIVQKYEEENWEWKIRAYEDAKNELSEKFGLRVPTAEEKLEAVRDKGNLTEIQRCVPENRFSRKISNLEIAALVQLKFRKTPEGKLNIKKFGHDEKTIIEKLLPGYAPLEERATEIELQRLKFEIIEKFASKGRYRSVYPSCTALYNSNSCGIETLRSAVRKYKEAEIVLEFMGKKSDRVVFRDLALTKGKDAINEDASLSADIEYANGKKASFDAVFDGVGESEKASLASRMAVEVFKLGMMLDPPQNEKQLEVFMSMADMAIFLNKDKEVGMCSSSTTGVAVLVNGKKAYTAHAGDSRWMLFRNNKTYRRSVDHSIAEHFKRKGLLDYEDVPEELSSVVASSLGSGFTHLDSDSFGLRKGDVFLLCSDGISDVVMAVEMEKILSEHPVDVAQRKIFELALSRDKSGQEYETPFNIYVWGKHDDKTLRMKKIE